MQALKIVNDILMFILELTMLLSLGIWGYSMTDGTGRFFFALLLPSLAGILWGILAAPKSKRRLKLPWRAAFALSIFLVAAWGLSQTGRIQTALVFATLAVVNQGMVLVLRRLYAP
jgi:hypothetical protein